MYSYCIFKLTTKTNNKKVDDKMTNEKTIKEMYLFFDYLYESVEQIGEEVLSDWSHKETPKKRFCVIDVEDVNEKELSTQGVWLYDNLEDAEQELKDWNE